MPVWDDDLRDARRPVEGDGPSLLPSTSLTPVRSHDDVRVAAQKDAAEIVARARRDIRRIVGDARRELLELSAQVQAANVELPDSALPDPALIEAEEMTTPGETAWSRLTPGLEPLSADLHVVPEDDDTAAVTGSAFATPLASPSSARTFVALFTLAGIVVVAGTVWWLRRGPAPVETTEPAAQVISTEAAGSRLPEPVSQAVPIPVPSAAGITVSIDVRRETWMRVTIDGEADAGRTYPAGETRRVEGTEEVSLRTGDAGGVLVSVNGQPASPFGPDGVSLTRRFTRSTPAPTASQTTAQTTAEAPAPAPAAANPAPAIAPAVPTTVVPRPNATAATPSVSAAVPPPIVSAQAPAVPARLDISASGRQWLDAYHRQDRSTLEPLGSPTLVINDDRRPDQKFPFGLEVTRAFEDEQLQLSGDNAVFTARMTERATTGAVVSRITQTWVRRAGAWQIQEARLVPEPASPTPR